MIQDPYLDQVSFHIILIVLLIGSAALGQIQFWSMS